MNFNRVLTGWGDGLLQPAGASRRPNATSSDACIPMGRIRGLNILLILILALRAARITSPGVLLGFYDRVLVGFNRVSQGFIQF